MKIEDVPFNVIKWDEIEPTIHLGAFRYRILGAPLPWEISG